MELRFATLSRATDEPSRTTGKPVAAGFSGLDRQMQGAAASHYRSDNPVTLIDDDELWSP
jgi:hypothetical protein